MLSSRDILSFQAAAARKAARAKKCPGTIFSADSVEGDIRGVPNLGTYLHPEWRRVIEVADEDPSAYAVVCRLVIGALSEKALNGSRHWAAKGDDVRLFVDSSGWGSPGEPALSFEHLVADVKRVLATLSGTGWALGLGIVEEGQFQCYLGVFVKPPQLARKVRAKRSYPLAKNA